MKDTKIKKIANGAFWKDCIFPLNKLSTPVVLNFVDLEKYFLY